MRDSLTNPPTTLFTLREPNATEGPALHQRQNQTPRPCNVMLHAAPAFPSHSPLPSRLSILGSVPTSNLQPQTSRIDRYTCRTKNAVSSSPSSKVPNLIDTEFAPAAKGCLHLGSSCRTTRLEALPISNLQLPPFRACYVVLHTCTRHQNIATPLSRYFPCNSNCTNKTPKISRHVFRHPTRRLRPGRFGGARMFVLPALGAVEGSAASRSEGPARHKGGRYR